jgi:hypothetical protein
MQWHATSREWQGGVDLRVERDRQRMLEFLRAVAETPVAELERTTVAGRDYWNFCWHDATAPTGAEIQVDAEVSVFGEVRFQVHLSREGTKRYATATVHPYDLAWTASVSYARSLIELAKAEALRRPH